MKYQDNRTRQEKARDLRYKRPALQGLGSTYIWERLDEIQEACDDVEYFMDSDGKTLLDALDGDEDEVWEFKMMFADLAGDAYQLSEQLRLWEFSEQDYDDVTVAMVGQRYNLVGYDSYETDYYHLVGYETEWAQEESAKRLMAKTKKELLECCRRNWCIFLAFFDLDQRYQHLKATMDILRSDNTAMLAVIRDIEAKYEAMMAKGSEPWQIDRKAEREFDAMLECLPDRAWVE